MISFSGALGIILASYFLQIVAHSDNTIPVSFEHASISHINIPSLPAEQYQFWLRHHPLAFKEFQTICSKVNDLSEAVSLSEIQKLHANLTIEDEDYLNNWEHGKKVLNVICKNIDLVHKSCWGYETNCQLIYLMPECHGTSLGQAKSEYDQKIGWFSQADFGFILERRKELSKYCAADKKSQIASSLECTKHFKMCRGDNLIFKFENLPKDQSLVSYPDVRFVKDGDVGGLNCDLQLKRIKEESSQAGTLQSWYDELKFYNLLQGIEFPSACDVTITKPAFIIKLDSPTNLYHYMCNFINLYITIHLNNRFSQDNQIIIWDKHLPRGPFEILWKAFSKNNLMSIGEFEGKRVCFKKFIFVMPPRMVNGLYYNTPLMPGCSKTGLFHAFNKHIMHRLSVRQAYTADQHEQTGNRLIRITLINRSRYRQIINSDELVSAISNHSKDYTVELVNYEATSFMSQLERTQNTDILIGIHGAGLTHSLFLPDWAAVFELFDCNDKCYHDLARLRGVSYVSSDRELCEKVPISEPEERDSLKKLKLEHHDKFSNYRVNVDKFLAKLEDATKRVKSNRARYFEQVESSPTKTVKTSHDEL